MLFSQTANKAEKYKCDFEKLLCESNRVLKRKNQTKNKIYWLILFFFITVCISLIIIKNNIITKIGLFENLFFVSGIFKTV